ncbi:hypothetical protein [Amycolatopsis sp. WAC 01416]|nr:hypothetical protein [Amycolatopsis sp. WAC 01416]
MAMATGHEHDLTGPAAEDAAARLTGFADRTGFTGAVVTDTARLRRAS